MKKILCRILIATFASIALTALGVDGSVSILQTLFTVLGIIFSIAMCLLVSFNLSRILNKKVYRTIRESIAHTRKCVLFDFSICSIIFVLTSLEGINDINLVIFQHFKFSASLTAITIMASSLLYEAYNFIQIRHLQEKIEEQIIDEDIAKQ